MPLDNKKYGADVYGILRELPEDREAGGEVPYQTKVEVYDSKCQNCQFKMVIVEDTKGHQKEFEDLFVAIKYATIKNYKIIRSCKYPLDIQYMFDKPVYPSLTEIVSNSCQFWNVDKLNIPKNSETKFIENIIEYETA